MDKIISVEKKHLKRAGEMLSMAFYNDPVYKYFTPDDKARLNNSYKILFFVLQHGLKYGNITAISDDINALLLWFPPDTGCFNTIPQIQCGALNLPFQIGFKSFMRSFAYNEVSEKLHNKHMKKTDYYLYVLAVRPEQQGKGYSSVLMRHFLNRIDFSKNRIYLETSNEKNIPIYEHFGFKIIAEIAMPKWNIKIWPMIKD